MIRCSSSLQDRDDFNAVYCYTAGTVARLHEVKRGATAETLLVQPI